MGRRRKAPGPQMPPFPVVFEGCEAAVDVVVVVLDGVWEVDAVVVFVGVEVEEGVDDVVLVSLWVWVVAEDVVEVSTSVTVIVTRFTSSAPPSSFTVSVTV
jgi:hypothetical protein